MPKRRVLTSSGEEDNYEENFKEELKKPIQVYNDTKAEEDMRYSIYFNPFCFY